VIVVDACAVVKMLLNPMEEVSLRERFFRSQLHAPQLIDLEVVQTIRRYNLMGAMNDMRALEAIDDFISLPIERHSHEVVLRRVWELRSNLTAYDAAYVALAELLGVPLVTTDKRLAKAAPHVPNSSNSLALTPF